MNRDPQNREGQKDPIFLLQKRIYQLTCCPEWLGHNDDGYWIEIKRTYGLDTSDWDFYDKGLIDERLLAEYLLSYEINGCPAVIEQWTTESVWLTRPEAEDYAKKHEHSYQFGWRVHCLSASGELAEILNKAEEVNV
jgi:hypothetical protein